MFHVTIHTGNDAFAESPAAELARILRTLAAKLDAGEDIESVLYDANGNVVGCSGYAADASPFRDPFGNAARRAADAHPFRAGLHIVLADEEPSEEPREPHEPHDDGAAMLDAFVADALHIVREPNAPMYSALKVPDDICPVSPVERYTVVLGAPEGTYEVSLRSHYGPAVACRRAHISLVAAGYGDLDTVVIISCTPHQTEDDT